MHVEGPDFMLKGGGGAAAVAAKLLETKPKTTSTSIRNGLKCRAIQRRRAKLHRRHCSEVEAILQGTGSTICFEPEAEDDKTPAKAFSYARNAYAADGTTKADAPEIEITVETLNFLVSYFCDLHVDRCARPGRSASV